MNHIVRRNRDLWDPFHMIADFQDEMNRVFGRTLTRRDDGTRTFSPDIDIREEADKFILGADFPAMRKEDLEVTILGNRLTLKGERKKEKEISEKDYRYSERSYGAFSRSFQLPAEVDAQKARATYKDGVLELVLPKSESAKPKQITVEVK